MEQEFGLKSGTQRVCLRKHTAKEYDMMQAKIDFARLAQLLLMGNEDRAQLLPIHSVKHGLL